jgi:hypothetical protein
MNYQAFWHSRGKKSMIRINWGIWFKMVHKKDHPGPGKS